jgi:hypothetical protein
LTRLPVLFLIAIILLSGCMNKKLAQPTVNPVITSQPTNMPLESSSGSDLESSKSTKVTPPSTQTESSSFADSNSIVYTNNQYGFRFSLPESWKGYSIVISKWESYEANDKTETGPVISIRDPRWTAKTPRQDIPIMVIPLTTWKSLLEGKIAIGAGPIAPSELDQNDKFVFAIPSRYNSSLPPGYEEVEKILQSFPLKAFN